MFSSPNTWTKMKQQVEETVNAWGTRPFVLGVGDQVAPNGDITMVKKISEMIKEIKI